MRRNVAFLATAVIVVSAVVNIAHTASHAGQHLISLPGWQLAYIAIVIYAAPVVAASVLWTRYRFAGARGRGCWPRRWQGRSPSASSTIS